MTRNITYYLIDLLIAITVGTLSLFLFDQMLFAFLELISPQIAGIDKIILTVITISVILFEISIVIYIINLINWFLTDNDSKFFWVGILCGLGVNYHYFDSSMYKYINF